MCVGGSPDPQPKPKPVPPPEPEPEFSEPERTDPTKDRLKKQSEGTEQLRIDRTRISTGDKSSGLQVNRAASKPRKREKGS